MQCPCIETSAKNNIHVEEAFQLLVRTTEDQKKQESNKTSAPMKQDSNKCSQQKEAHLQCTVNAQKVKLAKMSKKQQNTCQTDSFR